MYREPGNAVICAELGGDAKQDSASSLLESSSLPILTLPLGNIPFQNHLTWQSPIQSCSLPWGGGMGMGQCKPSGCCSRVFLSVVLQQGVAYFSWRTFCAQVYPVGSASPQVHLCYNCIKWGDKLCRKCIQKLVMFAFGKKICFCLLSDFSIS